MSDRPQRLLLEIQGFAASLEASHSDTLRMMADMLKGHPRAQDFEPTGHGGSDPTAVNGTTPDSAAVDGRRYVKQIEAAWTALRAADDLRRRYLAAQPRTEPLDPSDPDEWCRGHLELDDYAPRYRLDMCRSCAERTYQTGERPTKADIEHHRRTGRWPRKLVDPKQPMRTKLTAEQAAKVLASGGHIATVDALKLRGETA